MTGGERLKPSRENPYTEIERGVPGTIGWRIDYFTELPSTQDEAAVLAGQGVEQGTVVIAETQTAGRGRMGRQWHSPAFANLYATVILRPQLAQEQVPIISLIAGVAAAEALETVAPGLVALKWPNDVWLGGRKTGGILAEAVSTGEQPVSYVLLGIGLNLNLTASQIPAELRSRATSVRAATGRACDRIALAQVLFSRLNSRYVELESHGFEPIKPAWERYSALTGKRVMVASAKATQSGVVMGIDATGALLLSAGGESHRVLAGEVTIEGAYD